MLNCNIDKLPLEVTIPDVEHNHMWGRDQVHSIRSYWSCIRSTTNDTKCLPLLKKTCLSRKVTSFKTIRMKFWMIEQLLRQRSNLKVLFLVRDPRAVYLSLTLTGWYRNTKEFNIKTYCQTLYVELLKSISLQKDFPGRIQRVYYEKTADHPEKSAAEIYEFLGLNFTSTVKDYINEISHPKKKIREYKYGTARRNSTRTAHKWEKKIPTEMAVDIDIACYDTIKELGYLSFSEIQRKNT